jgi:acyl carrier protein
MLAEKEVNAIHEILIDKLQVKPETLTPEARIDADLGADSLDKVEIIMQCEEQFGVTVPDDLAEQVETVEDVYELVARLLGR